MALKAYLVSPQGSFFTKELVKFLSAEEIAIEHNSVAEYENICQGTCDVLLYDLALGEQECLNLCQKLQAEAGAARPASIGFARQHNEELLIEALDKGLDDILIKPVNLKHLLARIKNLMNRRVKSAGDGVNSMVNCFKSPAVITDGSLVINCCNQQACEIFGEDLVGKKISSLFPKNTMSAMESHLSRQEDSIPAMPAVLDTIEGGNKRVVVSAAKIDKWEDEDYKYMFVVSNPIANFNISGD